MLLPLAVIEPPDPIVVPADISGAHSASDTTITALIAAVTRTIVGPTGWLGRSLGEQTLLKRQSRFGSGIPLPCGPVLSVESVKYLDSDGDEQTVDAGDYRLVGDTIVLKPGKSWPSTSCEPDAVRVEYVAGYDEPPEEVRRAIILGVQHLRDLGGTETFLRSETVEGVGTVSYGVTPAASEAVRRATDSLLAGLRLWG